MPGIPPTFKLDSASQPVLPKDSGYGTGKLHTIQSGLQAEESEDSVTKELASVKDCTSDKEADSSLEGCSTPRKEIESDAWLQSCHAEISEATTSIVTGIYIPFRPPHESGSQYVDELYCSKSGERDPLYGEVDWKGFNETGP